MCPIRYRFLLCILIVFLSVSVATAQQRVTYIVSVPTPSKHVFHVGMDVPCAAGPLQLQIPSFLAGDPGARGYNRFIEHLTASLAQRNLDTERPDPYTWTVDVPSAGTVHVEYDVETDPKDDLQLDNHWVDETGGYFDGSSLFLYSEQSAHLPVILKLAFPASWKVATSLPEQEGGFFARNYVALTDSPVLFGNLTERTFAASGVTHRLFFSSSLPAYSSDALDANLEKITAYEIKLFGSAPFTSYVCLFRWHPDITYGGGIEHAGGMFMNIGKEWMEDLPADISGTFAHEYFHAWNGQAIHPFAFHGTFEAFPRAPLYTDLLWFQEGVTSYYAYLVKARTGIFSVEHFYASLSGVITQFEGGADRGFLSLADASTIAGSQSVEDLDYYSGGGRGVIVRPSDQTGNPPTAKLGRCHAAVVCAEPAVRLCRIQ